MPHAVNTREAETVNAAEYDRIHSGIRCRDRNVPIRAEYASLGAGRRSCAASSEHRVNTREAETVSAAEYDRMQWITLRSRGLVGRQEHIFRF